MFKRICYECKWFYWTEETEGYSEETPSSPAVMECTKGHWDLITGDKVDYSDSARMTVKKTLEMAETCRDYDPDPKMAHIGK